MENYFWSKCSFRALIILYRKVLFLKSVSFAAMKKIVLFGAGKSAVVLISFLSKYCSENGLLLQVCDVNVEATREKLIGLEAIEVTGADVTNAEQRGKLIQKAEIVISLLPPSLHFLVAKDCVAFEKNLLTASYVDESIASLASEIKNKGLIFIAEMGLDPGIDHMSAMKLITQLKEQHAVIKSFYSHCGGLVAPESDNNPWHYKITWNPANVVTAGSAGALYLQGNKQVQIPYEKVFANKDQIVTVENIGNLAWYANRNSLPYMQTYGLENVSDFIRTTLRYPQYCSGWNVLVQLRLTDTGDHEEIKDCKTYRDWFELKKQLYGQAIQAELNDPRFQFQCDFLGLTSNELIPSEIVSSAKLLQSLLEKNLVMQPHDKDMIIMKHEIRYELAEVEKYISSTLVVKGRDNIHTAMAKTVGLPLAIAATLIHEKKITTKGLHIPVVPEIYEPVLHRLKEHGIEFTEESR